VKFGGMDLSDAKLSALEQGVYESFVRYATVVMVIDSRTNASARCGRVVARQQTFSAASKENALPIGQGETTNAI
jgi:hypothetical protein